MILDYTQNFKIRASFVNIEGKQVAVPECDFCLYVLSEDNGAHCRKVTASRSAGKISGCSLADNGLNVIVPVKGYGLYPGTITVRITLFIPDSDYDNGVRTVRIPADADLRLSAFNRDKTEPNPEFVDVVFLIPDSVAFLKRSAVTFLNMDSVAPEVSSIQDFCSSDMVDFSTLVAGSTFVTFRNSMQLWEMWRLTSDENPTDPESWTMCADNDAVKQLMERLESIPVEQITGSEVEEWINELNQ